MVPEEDESTADPSKKGKGKRGFFGKLKDKAIGTKEEREAYKREQARVSIIMGFVDLFSEPVSA